MIHTKQFLTFFIAISSVFAFVPPQHRAITSRFAIAAPTTTTTTTTTSTCQKMSSKPIAIVVEAEIKEDRMEEFLAMIETNSVNSRKEPGCLKFDVLQSQENPNKFFFYEAYKDAAAVAFHKEQDHYMGWAKFKESGGTVSSVSHKADGLFLG